MNQLKKVIERVEDNSYMEVAIKGEFEYYGMEVSWDDLEEILKEYDIENNPSPNCFNFKNVRAELAYWGEQPPFRIILDIALNAKMSMLMRG